MTDLPDAAPPAPVSISPNISAQLVPAVAAKVILQLVSDNLSLAEAVALAIWLLESSGVALPSGWDTFTAQFAPSFTGGGGPQAGTTVIGS